MAGTPKRSDARTPLGKVHLTPSETCVLALLPTYLTLAAIGRELGVGRPTVKTHVQHIYEKLGASNRAEAVQFAESAGLLPASGQVRRPGLDEAGPETVRSIRSSRGSGRFDDG
jgi:DNA-binding NarL/FixJ family response regulator